jgi:hypothetical protein
MLKKYIDNGTFIIDSDCLKDFEYLTAKMTNINKISTLNTNSIFPETQLYFKKFIERYINSLRYEYQLQPDKVLRSQLYIESIMRSIFEDDSLDTSQCEKLVHFLIARVLQVKSAISSTPRTFSKNMNFIGSHGAPTTNLIKLPDNCILCVLTPFNRLSTQNEKNYKHLLTLSKDKNFAKRFEKNPMCYGRSLYNYVFSNADIYYGGQYYYDLSLSKPYGNDMQYLYDNYGLYKINNEINPQVVDRIVFDKIRLSQLISNNSINGIIILNCCRDVDELAVAENINETILMYRFEHMMHILNKTANFIDDKQYIECDKIKSYYHKYLSHYLKYRYYTSLEFKNTINKLKTLKSVQINPNVNKSLNLSLSISLRELERIISIDDINLINRTSPTDDSHASIYDNIYYLLVNLHSVDMGYKFKLLFKNSQYSRFINYDVLCSFGVKLFTQGIYKRELDSKDPLFIDNYNVNFHKYLIKFHNYYANGINLTTPNIVYILNYLSLNKNLNNLSIYARNNNITKIPLNLCLYKFIRSIDLTGNKLDFNNTDVGYFNDNFFKNKEEQKTIIESPDFNQPVYEYIMSLYSMFILRDDIKHASKNNKNRSMRAKLVQQQQNAIDREHLQGELPFINTNNINLKKPKQNKKKPKQTNTKKIIPYTVIRQLYSDTHTPNSAPIQPNV